MLDYEALRLIWWVLLGVLLIGFVIMDGFDLGIAMIYRFIGRDDAERRVLLETIEPVWEGNQVWLILGAGAIFAAWPILYATAFSGFYEGMLLVLLALILRPVALTFRGKLVSTVWRKTWDWALLISGVVPSLVFGIVFGNILLGVPFYFDETLRMTYQGEFFDLLNPFALLCGLVSISMLIMHGANYAALKTNHAISKRSAVTSQIAALIFVICFSVAGLWVRNWISGYQITSVIDPNSPSNPVNKKVIISAGFWLTNYINHPWMVTAPALAYTGTLFSLISVKRYPLLAFISSAVTAGAAICTTGFTAFPFLLPSSSHPNSSLTIWDASSSRGTLLNMLIAAVIFIPIILTYTSWVFRVLRGKIDIKDLHDGVY